MRLLLDTHIALWWITDDAALTKAAVAIIEETANTAYISAASIWEIAIKYARPKGRPDDMPLSRAQALADFETAGLLLLPVTAEHAAAVGELPHHHRDPFDRLLVAQALTEPLRLMTADKRLADYGDMILLV